MVRAKAKVALPPLPARPPRIMRLAKFRARARAVVMGQDLGAVEGVTSLDFFPHLLGTTQGAVHGGAVDAVVLRELAHGDVTGGVLVEQFEVLAA